MTQMMQHPINSSKCLNATVVMLGFKKRRLGLPFKFSRHKISVYCSILMHRHGYEIKNSPSVLITKSKSIKGNNRSKI